MKNLTRNKNMKKAILVLFSLVSAVGVASASNNNSYTATADPNNSPDGVDQTATPVNVWSVIGVNSGTGGGEGSYFGTSHSGGLSGWQIWTSPFGTGTGNAGSIDASTTFDGGALNIGQTVSINFEMRATDPGKTVGVSLLNGAGNAITFDIAGGGQYVYTDAGSTLVSAGSMGYQYQSPFNIAFTVTGAGTYSAVAGSDSWTGTFSGSLIGMDVFNHAAGDGSDVGFNNLVITTVPEPSTLAMLAASSVGIFGWRRIFRRE
jgi:hypothetical protein